jgi:hypothetical protein
MWSLEAFWEINLDQTVNNYKNILDSRVLNFQ